MIYGKLSTWSNIDVPELQYNNSLRCSSVETIEFDMYMKPYATWFTEAAIMVHPSLENNQEWLGGRKENHTDCPRRKVNYPYPWPRPTSSLLFPLISDKSVLWWMAAAYIILRDYYHILVHLFNILIPFSHWWERHEFLNRNLIINRVKEALRDREMRTKQVQHIWIIYWHTIHHWAPKFHLVSLGHVHDIFTVPVDYISCLQSIFRFSKRTDIASPHNMFLYYYSWPKPQQLWTRKPPNQFLLEKGKRKDIKDKSRMTKTDDMNKRCDRFHLFIF